MSKGEKKVYAFSIVLILILLILIFIPQAKAENKKDILVISLPNNERHIGYVLKPNISLNPCFGNIHIYNINRINLTIRLFNIYNNTIEKNNNSYNYFKINDTTTLEINNISYGTLRLTRHSFTSFELLTLNETKEYSQRELNTIIGKVFFGTFLGGIIIFSLEFRKIKKDKEKQIEYIPIEQLGDMI